MDWSLIALLFAVGFALAGLSFLIATIYKIFFGGPPGNNNSANAPPPTQTYVQPQPPPIKTYNWGLNSGQVQRLALGRGVEDKPAIPEPQVEPSEPDFQTNQETGLIPMAQTTATAAALVFTPEPVHQAVKVAPSAPIANVSAEPVPADVGLSENTIVANDPTPMSVETLKFEPDGPSTPVFKAERVVVPDEPQNQTKRKRKEKQPVEAASEEPRKEVESEPEVVPEPEPEPVVPEPAPIPDPPIPPEEPKPQEPAPEPPPINKPQSIPARNPSNPTIRKQYPAGKGKGKSRGKRKGGKKKTPAPPPTVNPEPKKTEVKPEPVPVKVKDKPKKPKKERKSFGAWIGSLIERCSAYVSKKWSELVEKVPEQIRNISLPVMFCICVAVCLLSVSLFLYFNEHPYVPEDENAVIVDIPQESPDETPEEPVVTAPPETDESLKYKMAFIDEQEAISTTANGFEETFAEADYTDVPFYSLTFAIQLDSGPGTEFQSIRVLDAQTDTDLTSTENSILHVYQGQIPSAEYFSKHPVKSAPLVSSAVSDELITCVFVSLDKRNITDLKVILSNEYNAQDGGEEVMVNGRVSDLDINPTYTMGNCLLKLGEQYYLTETGTGLGAVPDENKYVTRKLRCASQPLTGAVSGLNTESTAFFDRTTGMKANLPEGTSLYYVEDYEEGNPLMTVSFGISLSGSSYEEAAAFLDTVLPGYYIDGKSIMF